MSGSMMFALDFSAFQGGGSGAAGSNPVAGLGFGGLSASELNTLLASSPFSVLIGLPGISSTQDIINNIESHGSPFPAIGSSGTSATSIALPTGNPVVGATLTSTGLNFGVAGHQFTIPIT